MSSLRNKRKGRGPVTVKQISAPIASDGRAGPRSLADAPSVPRSNRPPQQGGGKTGDLVKRRYSTRFNNLPTGFDPTVPPIPALPPIQLDKYEQYDSPPRMAPPSRGAAAAAATAAAPPSAPTGTALRLDIKALRDPDLIPDQFVAAALGDATEDQIREYEDALRDLKTKATADLMQNVMQNRTQFIEISKGAEKLKREMLALKNLMSELKANTMALRSSAVGGDGGAGASGGGGGDPADADGALSVGGMSKLSRRSSVADRTVLWNAQMQVLYKNVEGSQKFLPPNAPGRHVIQNAGPWIELDNATYRSRRAMQIFLLNDHLLVASRKKRKADGPPDPRGSGGSGSGGSGGPIVKLVADRCWPLLDIEIVDMAGSKDSLSGRNKLADAVMVRGVVGQESFIYRTEKPEDSAKGGLLINIRKAVEELRKGLQSEMEATNRAKETINYFASRDPGLLQRAGLLETLSDIKDMRIEVDGNQQNLRWVEGQMDELDIHIAKQHFEEAVRLVERMRGLAAGLRNNAVAQDFIDFKLDERSGRLAGIIVRILTLTHSERAKTRTHVDWLAKLGYEDRAREAYLGARGDLIRQRTRQCIFRGDLHMYIWQISYVYFTLIHNTVQTFQMCFPPLMMSACVGWAKREVEDFNAILARQLSGTEPGGEEWTKCMDRAREHAGKLAAVGLDFRDLVGRPPPPAQGAAAGEQPAAARQQKQQQPGTGPGVGGGGEVGLGVSS